jgi:hypothetical protein
VPLNLQNLHWVKEFPLPVFPSNCQLCIHCLSLLFLLWSHLCHHYNPILEISHLETDHLICQDWCCC